MGCLVIVSADEINALLTEGIREDDDNLVDPKIVFSVVKLVDNFDKDVDKCVTGVVVPIKGKADEVSVTKVTT